MPPRLVGLVLLVGCSFRSSVAPPDAMETSGERPPDCKSWGARAWFDPCAIPELAAASAGSVSLGVSLTYDTATDQFTTPSGIAATAPAILRFNTTLASHEVRFWLVDSFELASPTKLRVIGSLPLIIAARGAVTISGTIDASSRYAFVGGPIYERGAGDGHPSCSSAAMVAGNAGAGSDGGSGGGGGGLSGPGGRGGKGGMGTTNEVAARPGGVRIELAPGLAFRGGCQGGLGGTGDGGVPGGGGFGGGAVMITAQGPIQHQGRICAGGAGGHGQLMRNRNGGGGGGSGGLIVLEAPKIDIRAMAPLAANGGGGGGGADAHTLANDLRELEGQNATCDAMPANGAQGESNVAGGPGAAGSGMSNGGDGTSGDKGGGGGGGGAGYVVLVAPTRAMITGLNNLVSPPALLLDAAFQPLK
jgi:hypothetical protein